MTSAAPPRRSKFRSISAKILIVQLLSAFSIALIVGGMGFYGMSGMAAGMASIYNDHVVPLRRLRLFPMPMRSTSSIPPTSSAPAR